MRTYADKNAKWTSFPQRNCKLALKAAQVSRHFLCDRTFSTFKVYIVLLVHLMNKEKSFFTLNIFIFFTLLYKNISLCISVKMGQPRSLFDLFSSLQTHITFFITNKCEKCPSSIRCWDSNWQPLEHESPPITTRPRKKLRKIRLISTTAQCDKIWRNFVTLAKF